MPCCGAGGARMVAWVAGWWLGWPFVRVRTREGRSRATSKKRWYWDNFGPRPPWGGWVAGGGPEAVSWCRGRPHGGLGGRLVAWVAVCSRSNAGGPIKGDVRKETVLGRFRPQAPLGWLGGWWKATRPCFDAWGGFLVAWVATW